MPKVFMATSRFYFDPRRVKAGTPAVLRIAIAHQHKTTYVTLETKLLPNQWDSKKEKVVNHPEAMRLNVYINGVKTIVDRTLIALADSGKLASMSVIDIRSAVEERLNPDATEAKREKKRKENLFATRFLKFADSKKESTRGIYMHTYNRMIAYVGEKVLQKLAFEDITKEWLMKFDVFMMQTAPSKNSRNIHMRNIRAVFNEAIDDEITTFYPFRRLKIRPVATKKRNLKVDDMRTLFNYPCEPHAVKYLDMFKLMFMLIGINSIDLCHLKEIDSDGRVTYHRAKTNRLYSIKVEPEALEIINKYRGKKYLLDILDRWKSHKDFTLKMNRTLKRIGPVKRVGLGGKKIYKPLFPDISTYWARHSWATIAASLDIPRDTIAHALGHGGNTVTDIYIDFDERKIDEANRKVLDWVLYGKK